MSLKIIRMTQRIIGVILLVYGVYLIFGTQEFFGTILIILAFLIFPSLNKEKRKSHSTQNNYNKHNQESSSDHDHLYESSNSAGESGD
ncbi:hypothetical protein M3226_16510 [Neobacillus cucumis]|uniref:hypothetical protein n=1 Tax=Neobacillus cucumis TaxID=1740721 RepID=UPI002042552B|nr:hypothetical protein [Neobacillus cucumis]MCM3727282.1 hypothetical protein [Neobacillus cucumis]